MIITRIDENNGGGILEVLGHVKELLVVVVAQGDHVVVVIGQLGFWLRGLF